MAAGTDTYLGLAAPLYGDFTITGRTAATDTVTIVQPATPTGNSFVVKNSSGTQKFAVHNSGRLQLLLLTTRPTTGLTKGELMLLMHTSTPKLGVVFNTSNGIKLIRLKTKTFGRLTA